MCLYLAKDQSVDQLFKKVQHKRTFWKVITRYGSLFYSHRFSPGKNISSRKIKKLDSYFEINTVHLGFHVFTSKRRAEEYLEPLEHKGEIILPVVCYKKDLVAIGKNEEAVFMSVNVEPRTYKRVFGKGRK